MVLHRNPLSLVRFLTPLVAAVAFGAAPPNAQPPSPTEAVRRACQAAGGFEAFRALGVLQIEVNREEVTQDGHISKSRLISTIATPGPLPGHMEISASHVVAGDDGTGGWALVNGAPDPRPSVQFMVKRFLRTDLFPILMPFSLTWEGVTVSSVAPTEVGGRPAWRLSVELSQDFFHTPQISTSWTVDLDRATFAILRADSPYTDLGKGVKADGMRFYWSEPVKVGAVRLHGLQRVIGLDEYGREKSHSRIDHVTFKLLPAKDAATLFANPIPPAQRPKPPSAGQPPQPGGPGN